MCNNTCADMFTTLIILVVSLVFLFHKLLAFVLHYKRPKRFPPGPSQVRISNMLVRLRSLAIILLPNYIYMFTYTHIWQVPILGSIPLLPKEFRNRNGLHMPKIFKYMAETYGSVSSLYLGPRPTVIVSDAKILKEIYKLDNVNINRFILLC